MAAEVTAPARLSWPAALGLGALHAALFAASFHPLALFPLAWLAFAPLASLIARGTRAQVYWGSFLATFVGGGAAVHWLRLFGVEPWLGTAGGFGLYGLFMAFFGRSLARCGWPAALWLPIVVVAQEYIRGHWFFVAFPWVLLGHSQYPIDPLIQSADLGGASLISFVMAAASGVLADAVLGAERRRTLRSAGAVAAVVAALCIYGAIRSRTIAVVGGGPRVLAVQANIPQELKNESERRPDLIRTHRTLTMDAVKAAPAPEGAPPGAAKVDLVVWPETMFPVVNARGIDPRLPYASVAISKDLRSWVEELGSFTRARILVGSIHAEMRGRDVVESNSAFLFDPRGEIVGRYDKMFPAPMSENTPFSKTWPAAYRFLRESFVPPGFSQFEPGETVPVWDVGGWKIAASVCFDITFPESTNLAVKNGADAIVNISNYGWFKDSAELDLARVQTIFRAIETRRGVVAVCNGGISSFVDPLGRAEDIEGVDPTTGRKGKKLVEGTLIRPLATSRAKTMFVALGDWCGAGSVAAAFALAAWARMRRRKT